MKGGAKVEAATLRPALGPSERVTHSDNSHLLSALVMAYSSRQPSGQAEGHTHQCMDPLRHSSESFSRYSQIAGDSALVGYTVAYSGNPVLSLLIR